jgi:uncharacterized membrane protein
MRKVIRGYAKDKNLNLILIGTIPVPHSKDKRSPATRQGKRYLVKVIRGYAKDKNLNLILIGTIPVPHSKDKRSPAARQGKRYLVRQGAGQRPRRQEFLMS